METGGAASGAIGGGCIEGTIFGGGGVGGALDAPPARIASIRSSPPVDLRAAPCALSLVDSCAASAVANGCEILGGGAGGAAG